MEAPLGRAANTHPKTGPASARPSNAEFLPKIASWTKRTRHPASLASRAMSLDPYSWRRGLVDKHVALGSQHVSSVPGGDLHTFKKNPSTFAVGCHPRSQFSIFPQLGEFFWRFRPAISLLPPLCRDYPHSRHISGSAVIKGLGESHHMRRSRPMIPRRNGGFALAHNRTRLLV